MTLLQLRYFVVLSENLHYTKSAEQLHISQPSLSYAITELEKELGVELFDRQNRKIILNENGQLFLRYVKNALSVLDEGTRMLGVLNGMHEDRIRLGYFYSLSSPFVPELVNRFYQDQRTSHVMFDFIQEQNVALLAMLKSGELDMAFCLSQDAELDAVPVFQQRMNLVVPVNHPLAQRTSVQFTDFCNEPMVLLTSRSQARNLIERVYRKHGKILHVAVEAVECNATVQFVALGRGVCIIPNIPALELTPVVSIPIEGNEFTRSIYLASAKGREPSAGEKLLRQYVLEHGAEIFDGAYPAT